jgi:dihydrofolate reductase
MRALVLVAQTSLDGFVAGPAGEFDNFIGGEENLEFVCSITDEADAALLGRISYQLLDSEWPTAGSKPDAPKNVIKYSRWYNAASKFVLSRSLKNKNSDNTYTISENIESEITTIKQRPGKNILIFGSPTAVRSLFELNLIDSLWIIVHPIIFGKGIPLFSDMENIIKLDLVASKKLSSGILCHNYLIRK